MKQQSVVLIGLMGAGKSTVGRLLAERLGVEFIDLDREIEQAEGRPIAAIFDAVGEAGFREIETIALRQLAGRSAAVVATGGGTPVDNDNRQRLAALGRVVWLDVSTAVAVRRTAGSVRPLLSGDSPAERLEALRSERLPAYAWADLKVNADLPAEAVVSEIERQL